MYLIEIKLYFRYSANHSNRSVITSKNRLMAYRYRSNRLKSSNINRGITCVNRSKRNN